MEQLIHGYKFIAGFALEDMWNMLLIAYITDYKKLGLNPAST